MTESPRFLKSYDCDHLTRTAFPTGGIGTGTIFLGDSSAKPCYNARRMDRDSVIQLLHDAAKSAPSKRISRRVLDAATLLTALEHRSVPAAELDVFLDEIRNAIIEGRPKRVGIIYQNLLSHLVKKHGLVRPNHYRDQWMAIGISLFGIPLGVGIGAALGNMAYLAIGLPFGLSIGTVVGMNKDNKARAEDRVLLLDRPHSREN